MKVTMKTSFLFVVLLCSVTACAQDFQKLPNDDVKQERINIGRAFSDRFFAALQRGKPYEFTDDGTPEMKKALTPEIQKNVYQQVTSKSGDYQSAEYAEAWTQKSNPQYLILRYKGTFSKSDVKLEIRIVLDANNKVAGFWVKPWSDVFG